MPRRVVLLLLVLCFVVLPLAGCGGGDEDTPATVPATIDTEDVTETDDPDVDDADDDGDDRGGDDDGGGDYGSDDDGDDG